MLPAIYFTFSRKKCDENARKCLKLDLLEKDEIIELNKIVEEYIKENPYLENNPQLDLIKSGIASDINTLKIIPKVLEPAALAASIFPGAILDSADSTCLVKNGTHPNTSGIIAPLTPMAVPIINLVKGIKNINKIINGIDLNIFINKSVIRYKILFSFIPPGLLTVSIIPNINPMINEMMPAIINI